MFINNFDPVAIQIFSIEIRWYSLAYIFGILLGWVLSKKYFLSNFDLKEKFDDYITYLIIGIIVGGRLGYVFFYNFNYYSSNIFDILKIWQGGMSFHGGLIGVIIASVWFSKKNNQNPFYYLDIVSIVAPIGIFFGRIANFINSELYGIETNLPWAVKFIKIDDLYRHPSQLYEAFFEGIVLFLILIYFRNKGLMKTPGLISGLFLIFYSIFRFIIEFIRVPDEQLGYLFLDLSMGQMISFIFLLFGIYLFIKMHKKKKKLNLSLDKFINLSLYDKKFGYYIKKNPFGKEGDFITAPNVSRLFPEMISIWIISFWQNLGSPKKFNLIELGAGNGEMMKIMIESFKNFPSFVNSCNFFIHEKSSSLIKIQKKKLGNSKVIWISKINKIKKNPCIFIANEFFDAIAIKQYKKRGNLWFERFINYENKLKPFFFEKKIDIKKIEKKIDFEISQNQNFIEYSALGLKYLKDISKIIKKDTGGLLLIDYGYTDGIMKNTLRGISNHKFANILSNIGDVDITHNINFKLFKKFIEQTGSLKCDLTTQKKFLTKMGINQRAEIISKNLNFLKKTDIYYRLKKLIDEKQMGNLFKVMFIKNDKNKFKLGF